MSDLPAGRRQRVTSSTITFATEFQEEKIMIWLEAARSPAEDKKNYDRLRWSSSFSSPPPHSHYNPPSPGCTSSSSPFLASLHLILLVLLLIPSSLLLLLCTSPPPAHPSFSPCMVFIFLISPFSFLSAPIV